MTMWLKSGLEQQFANNLSGGRICMYKKYSEQQQQFFGTIICKIWNKWSPLTISKNMFDNFAAFAEKWSTATTFNYCMEQQFVKRYPE